jgi:hypothetical protein
MRIPQPAPTVGRAGISALVLVIAAMAAPATLCAQGAPSVPVPTTSLPITFTGEVRTRTEWDRPASAAPGDAFTWLRSRFGVRVDPTPGARIVLQVQDSRVLGSETSAAPTALAADVFDLHQGYLELAVPAPLAVTLRVGRQEIALGNERLVGAVNWSNTGRSFDGARVMLAPPDSAGASRWTATAFAAVVDERGSHFGPASTAGTGDHLLLGAYGTRALPLRALADVTLLHDANGRYRAYDASTRTTLDARLRVPRLGDLLPLRLELEGAVQRGHQRVMSAAPLTDSAQSVAAWLAGVRVGTVAAPGRPVLTVGADVLSGDDTPTDGRYTAFATMYATNHPFYGLLDVIGDPATTTKDRGLVDLFATAAIPLTAAAQLRGELHHFALRAGADRPLGWEGDVVVPFRLNTAASIDAGYALFRAGRAAAPLGLGAEGVTQHWVFLQLTASF